jgi:hypothetical protein
MSFRNHLFVEQTKGYVKALEKSTCRVLNWREAFEYCTQNEAEGRFEGSAVPHLKVGQGELVSRDDEAVRV